MKRRTRLHTIIAATLTIAGSTAQTVAAASLPTGPAAGDQNLSSFYRWNARLPSRPGIMLRQEPLPAQTEITDAGTALRILYTSTDVRWHSGIVPVSGTLHLPKGQPPKGGWPLVAWEHGTLGVADSCAASWAGHRPRDAAYIDAWLKNGFAVVSTFPEGPYHPETGSATDSGSAYYTILSMVGGGLRDGSPTPEDLLTDKGRLLLAATRTSCNTDIHRVEAREGVTAANAYKSPAEVPPLMLHNTDMTPVKMPVPVFLGTGLADSALPPQRQYGAVAALCAAGSHILWKTYPGISHNGGVHAALSDELTFVQAVLNGAPEASNCATIAEPGAPGKPEPGHPYNG